MSERLMAMIATSGPAEVSPEAVSKAMNPYMAKNEESPLISEDNLKDASGFVVTLSGVIVAVLPFPFMIPTETLGTAIGGEYIWRNAGDVFLSAKGHFLLTVVNPDNDPLERLNQARVLTIVTAAIISASGGIGIFWQAADCVIAPARFLEEAKSVSKSQFASPLWFSFRFFPGTKDDRDDRIVCQSKGLATFLGREIECGPYLMTPAEIAETVILVARFMAAEGAVFGDGHTFSLSGNDDDFDARILFDWSTLGGLNKPIFQLRLTAQEEATA